MMPISLDSMQGRRILLLSPHADDAAYSVGGIVARLSTRADLLLVTVFGRSGWTLSQALIGASVDAISAMREQEDRAYCDRRQIKYDQLACPDSFLMGYDEVTELSVAPEEDPRAAHVVNLVGNVVARVTPDVVMAPCGLGGHVDHRIVRMAAQALNHVDVLYYEDVPYSARFSLADIDRQLGDQRLATAATVDIENVLESKCEDMWGYRSQTSELAVGEMLLHARRIGANGTRYAERLWRRAD